MKVVSNRQSVVGRELSDNIFLVTSSESTSVFSWSTVSGRACANRSFEAHVASVEHKTGEHVDECDEQEMDNQHVKGER